MVRPQEMLNAVIQSFTDLRHCTAADSSEASRLVMCTPVRPSPDAWLRLSHVKIPQKQVGVTLGSFTDGGRLEGGRAPSPSLSRRRSPPSVRHVAQAPPPAFQSPSTVEIRPLTSRSTAQHSLSTPFFSVVRIPYSSFMRSEYHSHFSCFSFFIGLGAQWHPQPQRRGRRMMTHFRHDSSPYWVRILPPEPQD